MSQATSPQQTNEHYVELIGPETLRFERVLPASVDTVWKYLTDGEKRAKWLAGGAMEMRAGGRLDLHFQHANLSDEKTAPERYREFECGVDFTCTVTVFEPPHRLAWSWPERSGGLSEVTFELTPVTGKPAETRLVITHARLADRTERLNVAAGWHTHVGILEDVLRNRHPRPFWTTHGRLEREYEKMFG